MDDPQGVSGAGTGPENERDPRPVVQGSGAAGASALLSKRKRIQNQDPIVFVLKRELSEVHLLLDNVSANPTTTVADRKDVPRPKMLEDDWIERVCEINWPPEQEADKAYDAALLINAKDYLNRLAHPASGSTIAFTHLVTQEDDAKRRKRRRAAAEAADAGGEDRSEVQTRSSLAETAYPDLLLKAAKFRRATWWMSFGLLLALAITCLLSWHVAYGNAMLAELNTAQTQLGEARTRVAQAQGSQATGAQGGQGEAQGRQQLSVVTACQPVDGAGTTEACAEYDEAADDLVRVHRRLAGWECWFCWNDADLSETAVLDAPSVASAWANILGSAVLPFFYGLLGAGAAIIRSLSRKIRASLLSPRDLLLSLQQLALGAVVGACIGLFIAAPGGDSTGESLLGPVTLSASAISFVAGFGVDAVFQGLEALIGRIFNLAGRTPTNNRGDGVAHN